MKTIVDKMRVVIDLTQSDENIIEQILAGYSIIESNELMIQKIKCNTLTKKEIISNLIEDDIFESDTFCTAQYVIDDSLDDNIVILSGGLPIRLDPSQF